MQGMDDDEAMENGIIISCDFGGCAGYARDRLFLVMFTY